ncbi:unnamed protein product [Rhodiola kirilowii]
MTWNSKRINCTCITPLDSSALLQTCRSVRSPQVQQYEYVINKPLLEFKEESDE